MYGALGVGFIISGFISHLFKKWIIQTALIATSIEGVGHALVSQSPNLWVGALFLIFATIGAGVGNASVASLIMQSVPKHVHGRVFALFDTTSSVTISLSMVITGILLDYIPSRIIGLWAGALIVFSSLVGIGLLRIKLPEAVTEE